MKSKASIQYTLRQVPREIDSALRKKSRRERKSLNQVAIEALSAGLAVNGAVRYHDLDFAIGTWVEDKEFDAAIKDQDKIDEVLWR